MSRVASAVLGIMLFSACAKTETLELGGDLGVPELVDFGECAVGVRCTPAISIRNNSDVAIDVDRLDTDRDDLFRVELFGAPRSLPPRSTVDLLVGFTAIQRMDRAETASLLVSSDFGTLGTRMAGRGVAGLEIEPSPFDLGPARSGGFASRGFLIRSLVGDTLTVFRTEPPPSAGGGTFELSMSADVVVGRGELFASALYTPSTDPFASGVDGTTWTFRWCKTAEWPCETSVELRGRRVDDPAGSCVKIEPASVDFGEVTVGGQAARPITLRNECPRAVSLINVDADAMRTGAFAGPDALASIPAGGALTFDLIFGPLEARAYASELRVLSDDPRPIEAVPLRGSGVLSTSCVLEIAVADIDFGRVELLRERTAELAIRNFGGVECALGPMMLSDNDNGAFRVVAVSSTIAAGATGSVVVGFRAEDYGLDTAELSFTPWPNGIGRRILLAATGADDTPAIYPDAIDFGAVEPGCARVRSFRLANHRAVPLELASLGLTANSSRDFSLIRVPASAVLEPNSEMNIDVRYTPADAIADSGVVEIFEVGVAEPYTVRLFAREGATQIERFDIPEREAVDVIFVFDTSGSMFEELNAVSMSLPRYFAHADASGYDDQISSLQVPLAVLAGTVDELRAPRVLGSNPRLLRRDAALSIVFFSDEDDESPSSVRAYADELLRIHGARNKNALRFQTVTGGPLGCTGMNSTGQASPRWTELSLIAPGAFESICADYDDVLDSLAREAYAPRSFFLLENLPLGAIRVRIDGAELPMFDANAQRNWSADTTIGAVAFSPGHEPEPGAEVEIEYSGACE